MDDLLLSISLWWLNLFGLDPNKNHTVYKKIVAGICITSLMICTILVAMALLSNRNLDTVADVCNVFFPFFQSTLKMTVMLYYKQSILRALETLQILQKHNDIRFDQRFAKPYKIIINFLFIMRNSFTSAVVLMVLRAIYLGNNELPYIMWVPRNWNAGKPFNVTYIIYFIVQTVNGFMLILNVGAFDSFYSSLITHIVGQISILNNDMCNIFDDMKVYEANLRNIVCRHNLILTGIGHVERTYSTLLLLQLLSNMCNICMGLFIININGFTKTTTAIQLLMVGSSLIQLFMYCFFGYQVTIKLQETYSSIYKSSWWEHPSEAKNIFLIILRSQRINHLTIGGVLNLDFATFIEVLKKSFSFYTLLQAQRNEFN